MKKGLIILGLFVALIFGANRSQATHLYGGDISYAYLGDTLGGTQHVYGILMTLYLDCNSPFWGNQGGFPNTVVNMNVFEGPVNATSLPITSQVGVFPLTLNDSVPVESKLPLGCQGTQNVCIYKVTYTGVVVVPTSFVGYHFIYDRCCRTTLTNINVQAQSTGTLLHAWTASTSIQNTSPKFRDLDFPFLCQGDTSTVLNLAQDIDGHQLNYAFYEPFDGESGGPNPPGPYTGIYAAWPPTPVNYQTGFSLNQPFGTGGVAILNGLTGYTTLYSPITGTFVIGVEVKEIDQNGFTVGVIHREYQFPVVTCNDTNTVAPVLQTAQTDYVIDAGDTLCFDIAYHDANGTLGWIYSVDGAIFDPNFTNPAATLTTPVISGDSSRQTFCWNTTCALGRSTKYYFSVTAADSACLPGVTNTIFSIEVRPFDGPQQITGTSSLCAGTASVTYTTDSIAGATYTWNVTGGTVVGGGTGPNVTVDWGNGPGGNVQVFATNAQGCVSSPIDLPVFVSTFDVRPGADRSICLGDTTTLGSTGALPTAPAGFGIKWTPNTTLDFDTAQNPRAFPSVTTTYIITVTDTTGLCKVVDSVTVTVLQNQNTTVSNDTTICQGSQVQLQASGGTQYSWAPAGSVSNANIANPITNITSTTLFTVTVTDTAGGTCPAIDSVLVTVHSQSSIDAGADSSICEGDTLLIGGNPTGPAGSVYVWGPSTNLTSTNVANPQLIGTTIGVYKYLVTVTTSAACILIDSVTITVDTIPVVDLTTARNPICVGDTAVLTASGSSFYTWTPSTLPPNPTQTVTPTDTTTYIVVGRDSNFCSASDTLVLLVNPVPEIDIPFDSVFLCLGDSLSMTATPGAASYLWTPNSTIIPNNTSAAVQVFPSTNTTYRVDISNLNGCDNTDSIFVEVDDTVPTEAGLPQSICSPDTIVIGGSPTSPLFNTTFSWSPTTDLDDPTLANPSTFTTVDREYFVTARNGSCIGVDSVMITVRPKPTITFTQASYEICAGDTIQIDTLSTSGDIVSYSWTPIADMSSPFVATPFVFPTTTTVYTVVLTGSNGCTDSAQVTVNVTTQLNVDAGPDTSACRGDLLQLRATGAVNYRWDPATGLNNDTIADPIATVESNMMYIVLGTDNKGCSGADTINITLNSSPTADAGGPFIICQDTVSSIRLGGNPSGPTTGRFSWSSAEFLNDPTIANPTTQYTQDRTYYLLVVDTVTNCSSSDSTEVKIYGFSATGDEIECNGDSSQLSVTKLRGTPPYSYLWTPSTSLSSDTIANPVATPNRTTTYQVLVTDSNGCMDSTGVVVSINNPVIAQFDVTVSANCDRALAITNNQTLNATDYQWLLDGTPFSTDYDIQAPLSFNSVHQITLIATNEGNCVDTSSVTKSVLAFDDYFNGTIPNVFTPNGDGFNDLFDIQLGQRLEQCSHIWIYNRWGELLFESVENHHTWDGRTFTGEECVSGTYFYVLEINGTQYNGSLTLIR